MEQKQTNTKLISLGVLIAVVMLVVVVAVIEKKDSTAGNTAATSTETTNTSPAVSDTTTSPTATDTATTIASYKAGEYSASGTYATPESFETIDVTLTVSADGTITDAKVSQTPQDRESEQYQSRFANNYKGKVVGKSISSLKLSTVSGASLTTGGFNEALQAIVQDAAV